MKKIFLLMVSAILTSSALISCGGKKEAPADKEIAEPEFVFTKQDTARVMELVNDFMYRMKERDIRGAVERLSYLNGDTIEPLSPSFKNRQAMSLIPIAGRADYDLERIVFNSDIDNEAKINVILFEKEEGDPRPNKTSFYLRPIRRDGQWYLTTKDNITDSNELMSNANAEVDD